MPNTKNVKLGVCRITYGGVDLGYTKGGVEVEVTTETHKTTVDQFGTSALAEFITGRDCVVTAPLAETSLENLVAITPGATLTETGGAYATGTVAFADNPSDGEYIVLNGKTITFKDTPVGTHDCDIGVDLPGTLDNLIALLNGSTDPLVSIATYTEDGTDTLTVTYDEKSVDGNDYTLAKGDAIGATLSGATLSGGVDSLKRVDVTHGISTSLLDFAKELVLHPWDKADSDKNDDFRIAHAGVSGALSFAFKVDEERVFNATFTAYPDSDTNILFQVGDPDA